MLSYAGIGSRKTPMTIQTFFEDVGAMLAYDGMVLRSGHAVGADQAFERGCHRAEGISEIYLPWKGFEGSSSELILKDRRAFAIAKAAHPRWDTLSNAGKALQARNSHQILGLSLNDPCEFVVCWTTDGKVDGGTGQALRLSTKYDLPVFNAGRMLERNVGKEFDDFYAWIKWRRKNL